MKISQILSILIIFVFSIGWGAKLLAEVPAASPAAQVTTIGQVIWVKGHIMATMSDNKERPLKRGDYLYQKDTLVTDKSGSGQVAFTDGTMMTLRENTSLKLENYQFNKNAAKGQDQYLVSLAKGGFRTVTGAIAKNNPDGYKIKTPVATIGFRGTDVSAFYCAPGETCTKNSKGLSVKIDTGQAVITNLKGQSVTLDPTKNVATNISNGFTQPVLLHTAPPVFNTQPPIQPAPTPAPTQTPPPQGVPAPVAGSTTATPAKESGTASQSTKSTSTTRNAETSTKSSESTSTKTSDSKSSESGGSSSSTKKASTSSAPKTPSGGGGGGGSGSCGISIGAPTI